MTDTTGAQELKTRLLLLEDENRQLREQAKALHMAQAREQKYQMMIQKMQDVYYRTDAAGLLTFISPSAERIIGAPYQTLIGKALSSFYVDPSRRETFIQQLLASDNGEIKDFQAQLRRIDGTIIWFATNSHVLLDEQGHFSGVEGIARDITELKQMEAQFHQAQKMEAIGTLVSGIAHDFNNMLAGMTGSLHLMKSKLQNQPKLLSRVYAMEKQAFQASTMIKQLLYYARCGDIEVCSLPLPSLVQEVMKFSNKTMPKNIHIQGDICANALPVLGDASLLQQVLMNLMNNAHHALADVVQPTITVELQPFHVDATFAQHHRQFHDQQVLARLTVSDNGCGIAAKDLPHIFEPFFTTKSKEEGTGLGLAMIEGAVQSHHGIIKVQSQPQKGTAFSIYLPLDPNPISQGVDASQLEIPEGDQQTLLLVDDDEVIREVTTELLESLNYRVIQAKNGVEASEIFCQHKQNIDLLLTDVVMPQMGGWELSRYVWSECENFPTIFISGYADHHLASLPDALEHVRILKKACSIEMLSQTIDGLLHKKSISIVS